MLVFNSPTLTVFGLELLSDQQQPTDIDPLSFATTDKPYNISEVYDLKALELFYEQTAINTTYLGAFFRRLIGSNCILVERGEVTPYYACLGCKVEEAVNCIEDMRLNKTGNVRYGCKINSMHEDRDENCCPSFVSKQRPRYIGLAYPEALRCLERVGCGQSVFYDDLYAECRRSCKFNIPGSDRSVCFAGSQGMFLTNLRSNALLNKPLNKETIKSISTLLSLYLLL